jgi:hypothetical protein
MDETIVFALEAADDLDVRAKQARGMLSAIPAIVAHERLEQHNELYEAEARRWERLANAVRANAEALTTIQAREATLIRVLRDAKERECSSWCDSSHNDHTRFCHTLTEALGTSGLVER